MTPRHLILTLLATAHLALAAASAAHVPLPAPDSLVGWALRWYGGLTGTDGGFAFFAPEVGSPSRAHFTLVGADGRTWTDVLDRVPNQEVRLRVSSIMTSSSFEEVRDPLAASWAGKMFGRHPSAREVVIRIETHDMPPLEAYRDGARPAWVPTYEVSFRHDGPVALNQEPAR